VSSVSNSLAAETGMPETQVSQILRTACHRYKVYKIPKRNGVGKRTIAHPSREVKRLQRLAHRLFLNKLPVHGAAHAYVTGRAIRTNAAMHLDARFVLKLDFRNFFPSIRPPHFVLHVAKHLPGQLEQSDLDDLIPLLFWLPKHQNGLRLAIGAPTSPFISNSLVFDIDVAIADLASGIGAVYTRYADDLTFSTSIAHALDHVEDAVRSILSAAPYPKLRLNKRKTVFASMRGRRQVTGIVVTNNGALSIGRHRKRLIRAMYHRSLRGELDDGEIRRLAGLLAFANDIEPDFVERLRRPKPLGARD